MFSNVFLTVTAGQTPFPAPQRTAYMACHFSPYSTGLSNEPKELPVGSLLLVDDSMPITAHDPVLISKQLKELLGRFSPSAVLLDFQRTFSESACAMASAIRQELDCPVAITKDYAKQLGGPVILPPPPATCPLDAYLTPWSADGIYLEIGLETVQITVTAAGSKFQPLPAAPPLPLRDTRLFCHYGVSVSPGKAIFTVQRTREDLTGLAQAAYAMGVKAVVGLAQELL